MPGVLDFVDECMHGIGGGVAWTASVVVLRKEVVFFCIEGELFCND